MGEEYYYAHIRTLAQFFAWHKQVRETTNQVEQMFQDPQMMGHLKAIHDLAKTWGPYNSKQRDQKWEQSLADPGVQALAFSTSFPPNVAESYLSLGEKLVREKAKHCFPKEFTQDAYLDRFFNEAYEMGNYCCAMSYYSMVIPEFYSIAHPNAQIDNAFYWRDGEGNVQCGLLDFGGVGFMPIPTAIANGWIGAESDMMDEHEERLIQAFIDEYAKITGFRFDHQDLWMHIKLAHATVLPGCCANVGTLISKAVDPKDWPRITSRRDPLIDDNFLARCYFVQIEMFLAMWKKRSPYPAFKKFLQRTGLPSMK